MRMRITKHRLRTKFEIAVLAETVAMAAALNRREQLIAWRQQSGRTPMKRLSYVKEYATKPSQLTHTPSQKITNSLLSLTTSKEPSNRKYVHTKPRPKGHRHSNNQENVSPQMRASAHSKPLLSDSCGSSLKRMEGRSRKEMGRIRRQMLEEWQALHGRTLKRPSGLLSRQQLAKQDRPVQRKGLHRRRHTMCGGEERGGRRGRGRPLVEEEREALKKRFLSEIAQDYLECSGEEWEEEEEWEGGEGCEDTARELQFDNEEKAKKHHRWHPEEGSTFKSTTVRYMLSEPRRRRSCVPDIHTAYLTPVRRSTRPGRNRDGPGMKLDEDMCFNSPSDVAGQLEFEKVQLMPNNLVPFDWGN